MPKPKSGRHSGAIKALRQSRRRALRNRAVRKAVRSAAKNVLAAVSKGAAAAARESYSAFSSRWDKAAKKGVIHWKSAARKKSRLARKVGAISPPVPRGDV